ncbi:MAG: PEP-CTERM sorting domain-containing protein [Armatimonadetes bacterium]|nr:PEP-CTERM sorting domain-containing protein [Armatimonadota bacterium]MBX3108805.1 PEP-CTERM sorting domain-containing protein [Fimbriimonadaceae bacterium]
MTHFQRYRALAPIALTACAVVANAELHYHVTEIGGLPGADHSYISAINNLNHVVGTSYAPGTSRGFMWREDWGVLEVHLYHADSSVATDINDNDAVVGFMSENGFEQGFTTHYGGWWFNEGIGGVSGGHTQGINNLNQSVGGTGWAEDVRATGWLLGSPGFGLPNYGPQEPSVAFRINDSGESVGWARLAGLTRATWFRNNNTVFDLHGMLPGGTTSSIAKDINNLGWVVGHFQDGNSHSYGFVFNQELGMQVIDYGTVGLNLNAINNSGMAVGRSNGSEALIWTQNTGLINMNSLIDPNDGWDLVNAIDINDNGWITGHGVHNGVYTTFVARPDSVPEPASLSIIAIGLGTLVARRRR